jgi:site-specific DNA-cytosine methylase
MDGDLKNYFLASCGADINGVVKKKMKVLIACEESQAVCKAFRAKGHEAYSCDILPCSGGHPEWHLQGDVLEQLDKDWDMIIAHPPCDHLAVSGARHFVKKQADGRQQQGIDFFMKFTNVKCTKVVIENPVGIMSTKYRKPDQIIQPFQFGDPFKKTTCLWLKGLPLLKPTNIVDVSDYKEYKCKNGKVARFSNWINVGGKDRKSNRSKTFQGIANAMAEQWS